MTFEFLKEKYPKENCVVVHSITELAAVFTKVYKTLEAGKTLNIMIPVECIELSQLPSEHSSKGVRLGIIDFYNEFKDINVFILMTPRNYRRGNIP